VGLLLFVPHQSTAKGFVALTPRVKGISLIESLGNSAMAHEGSLDIAKVRSLFPSLSSQTPYLYADNAGGSQCSGPVIDRIVDYLSNSNVQLGADYSVSKTSADRVDLGKETARILFNASSADEIALGSSSTLLMENLARAIEGDFGDEDEIIVTGEHEGMDPLSSRVSFLRVCERSLQRMAGRGRSWRCGRDWS